MIVSMDNHFSLTIAVGDGGRAACDDASNSVYVSNDNISCVEMRPDECERLPVDQAMEFRSTGHQVALLGGLQLLRQREQLLDVTLWAEQEAFKAHRVVLASCSDYFRAMFTDPMKERVQTDIYLAGVSAAGMKYLLDYIYTSKLELSISNIQDVLSAASHLQVLQVVEACQNYLKAQLDVDNSVDIVTIAETYSLDRLKKKVYRFMSENLSAFARTHEFQRLSCAQIEHLLSSGFPVDVPEEKVLDILLNWIEFDRTNRLAYAHRLLRTINFDEISSSCLRSCVERRSNLPSSLIARLTSSVTTSTSKVSSMLVNSRGMELSVVKVGGFGNHGVTNQVTYYLPSLGKWRHLTSIPHVECCNFGTAVLRNELFVVGGCFNQSLQEHIHPFGFRYDPRHDKWSTLTPMQRERCRFSLTVIEDSIFAIGGCSELGDEEDCLTCERYDPSLDLWTPLPPLPGSHRSQHASVRWHDKLLVSGGLDHDLVLDSMVVFDPREDRWEGRRTMPVPRADHSMIVWKDKVYLCGGWFDDESSGSRVLVENIDVYDFATDTWSVETKIPTPRLHAGTVIVQDKIFFIGGFLSDITFDRATGLIECYDMTERTWTTEKRYPQEIWEHACATLYIPRCREDLEVAEL